MGPMAAVRPERTVIGGSLEISRMINGLWQRADGHDKKSDIAVAVEVMDNLTHRGLDTFDMADHYGDAVLALIHTQNRTGYWRAQHYSTWCEHGSIHQMVPSSDWSQDLENAEAAVDLALRRMNQKKIHLLQYVIDHAWDFSDDTYLHNLDHLRILQERGKIGLIGLTNTDAAHLELLLDSGFPIATNQIPTNVIDRRLTRGRMNDLCLKHDVGILAYATLLGGFLSEKWLRKSEPASMDELNWSLRKYLRFIWAAGGWGPFQVVLEALNTVAQRHGVSIAAVATRYVLDIPSVKAVIVGSRLSDDSEHYVERNLEAFQLNLSKEDLLVIQEAQEGLTDIPNDCGDEYRRAPILTAAGDTSHHFEETTAAKPTRGSCSWQTGRVLVWKQVGADRCRKILHPWVHSRANEIVQGYCRAVRAGNVIRISGTTANSPIPTIPAIGGCCARSQTVRVLDIIENALKALGSSLSDVVRTRIMIRDASVCEEVSRAHGWVFQMAGVRPANTLVTAGLVGDHMLVEIEAEAEVECAMAGVYSI
ncbi:NADP-dependent oxidoreductase domain-containing protein [Exophiala viscosa]|uniref:NADP-dependent oxidoreductase domain-containing protein n=1 Tax=Exophiala viscosa TaxID=2486360 RepID=UPI0021982477|nr:NADP-dependent oxidoreductase domain-containing protein [Exophiala viscosa]